MFFTKKVIIISLLAFIVFIVACLPARVAYQLLPQQQEFALTGINGTVWQGKALRIKAGELVLDQITWDLGFWSLFTGKLGGYIRIKDKLLPTKGYVYSNLSGDRQIIDTLTTKLTGQFVTGIINQRGVTIDGVMMVDAKAFEYSKPMIETADLSIDWHDAQVNTQFGQVDLGHVTADIKKINDGELNIKLNEIEDVLDFRLNIVLKKTGAISIKGSFKSDIPKNVSRMLQFMNATQEKDRLKIDYKGAVPIPKSLQF
jgi:general secretion pathway protein N